MSIPVRRADRSRRVAIGLGAVLLLGFAGWRLRAARSEPVVAQAADSELPTSPAPASEPVTAPAPPPSAVSLERAADGVPIMGAHGDTSRNGPRHPHPITPEHLRIFRENSLIGELNGAMDSADFRALRQLNAQYRREYPEDANVLQAGYDLIADCLEQRTPENRAKAQEFFDTKLASILRRYVRRHCLE